ncbi:MAG: DUF983 domain-containing protein [Pseudomonadota bacterium]|nr:DUF983 domain-containing protein [Pseudomonadota bacterium]
MRAGCDVCKLDLSRTDPGDGAIFGAIFVLSIVVTGLAAWVELAFRPPIWVHVVIWPIVTVPLAILLMRVMKAALVALQFRNRSSEMGL